MNLSYTCPGCGERRSVPEVEARDKVRCACGHERPLRPGGLEGGRLRACLWCATEDLYVQKDFPPSLGLAIIGVGFAISSVFYYYYMPFWALGVLVLFAAADGLLYRVVPDVLTCYRCECQYRGAAGAAEGRAPFDLAVGERFRQERLRIEEHRRRGGPSGTSAG